MSFGGPEFARYNLSKHEVQVQSNREIGRGSYATVCEVRYNGLKCAGKRIHDELLDETQGRYPLERFHEECRLLSKLRHPNIIQFLGLHFQDNDRVPLLVMEYLPTNLSQCIEQYHHDSIFSDEIRFSILHDVALGLHYLHSYKPDPIVHRDLSSNNILLTINMSAKISDLGVAKIVNLSQQQVQLTQTPGTRDFMPPEVLISNPVYGLGVDIFSYGIIMIHMFTGIWPHVKILPNHYEGSELIAYTEAERRAEYLHLIPDDHALKDLILQCIHNLPNERPAARNVLDAVSMLIPESLPSFNNQLEMLQRIKSYESQRNELEQKKNDKMRELEENVAELRSYMKKTETISEVHSSKHNELHSEIKVIQTSINELCVENEILETKVRKYCDALDTTQLSLQDAQDLIADAREDRSEKLELQLMFSHTVDPPLPPLSLTPAIDSTPHTVEDPHFPNHISPNYTFHCILQNGYFGTTWKGVDNAKSTDILIKHQKPDKLTLEKCSEQAIMMNKFHHPNVIKLLTVLRMNETMIIITETMKNSLLQYLRLEGTHALPLQTVINISMQVIEGMIYLGKQKCIHRDLAARNIFVREGLSLLCKIANFDLTTVTQDGIAEADSSFMFPVKWTACETLSTNPHKFSTKSDVWSFGILLWEIVTRGCCPYSRMSNQHAREEVISGYRMPCPPGCPKEIYAIMLECWRHSPRDRPKFEELLHQLKHTSVLKHTSKTQDTAIHNSDPFQLNSTLYTAEEETDTLYGPLDHSSSELNVVNMSGKGLWCEALYIPSNYGSKNDQKQHIQITEEIVSISHPGNFTTYKGVWNRDKPVVIKAYAQHSMSTADFVQQATIMVNLRHTNVSRFYSAFMVQGSMYIVTEVMDTNLSAYLQNHGHSLTQQKLLDLPLQIANGMIYLEEQNCILRNLSAANILTGFGNRSKMLTCKIANFDLAIIERNVITADPESKFPLRWCAPEAIIHSQFSSKSDVWSFGVLLWEIITFGSTPYHGMTNCQVREYLHEGYHMSCPRSCPKRLYDTVMIECWKENPNERPTFKTVKASLKRYQEKNCEIYIEWDFTKKLPKVQDGKDASDSSSRGNNVTATNPEPVYQAELDYEAKEECELSFKKDDLLSVNVTRDSVDTNWCWSTAVATGKEGFVPIDSLPKQPLITFRKKLSKGTSSPIWECIWKGTKPSVVRLDEAVSSYTTEIIALQHTNIVQMYTVLPKHIIMEPMKFGKLNEFLQDEGSSLDFLQLVNVSTQIATGMAYLEEKNCILRNLAARNILVGDHLKCKISNFSSAKIVKRSYDSTEGGIYTYIECGIPIIQDEKYTRIAVKWTAPESATRKIFSTRSDVWSFGILLSEVITRGDIPYPNMSNDETLAYVLDGKRMCQPGDCPQELYSIMLDCWEQEFTQRPNFDCLKTRLEELLLTNR